jgi:uncharacterized protein YbjT (DUF2867 family)
MILVTGATGNFGSAAVAAAQAANVKFRALAHSAEKAEALRQRGIDVAVGDLARPESLAEALRGISALFLSSQLSPALADVETATLRAAREAGVKRVVKISSFSIGTKFQGGLTSVHATAEAALRESGLEWTVLRPTPTMGSPLSFGYIHEGVLYATCADVTAAYCAPADVGELGVRILEQGGHAGKVYSVTGPEALDLSQVAAIVAAEVGRPLRYQPTSDADYSRLTDAAGIPKSVSDVSISLSDVSISFFQLVRAGSYTEVLRTVESLLGRAGTSYRDWARVNAARWIR